MSSNDAQGESGESGRDVALREAQQVLHSMPTSQLDQFNLLGVVANPRGIGSQAIMSPPPSSSSHHGHSKSRHGSGMTPGLTSVSSDDISNPVSPTADAVFETYHSLEMTISQVTEQIDALNNVFEDWSRQYLEDFYFQDYSASVDTVPESQLQQLPPELTNLEWNTLQTHMNQTGVISASFRQRRREVESKRQLREGGAPPVSSSSLGSQALDDLNIPRIFFQNDFDLTDPKTFTELLLYSPNENGDAGTSPHKEPAEKTSQKMQKFLKGGRSTEALMKSALEENTNSLLHLPPPEHFTGYLDRVEVALLQQVQDKAEDFFQETTRFAQLKELVGGLLKDVQTLRSNVQSQTKSIKNWQQIPNWDKQRQNCSRVENIVESANEIIRCKQSIGGLLSAKDDLGAIEQIQYARRLLEGRLEQESTSEHRKNPDEQPLDLGRLHALRTVGEQLTQYETLVVNNLTEELVEIFMDWNTSSVASIYGGISNGSSFTGASKLELQQRVRDMVESLKLCKRLNKVLQFYGNRLQDVVRMTVRTTVGEFASDESKSEKKEATTSVSVGVTSMSLERFYDCLDLLFEQLVALLKSASGVTAFCKSEGWSMMDEVAREGSDGSPSKGTMSDAQSSEISPIARIVMSAAELASKSVSELLRLRKEAHSLISLNEMKRIWDTCSDFSEKVEQLTGYKAVALRSMMLAQAKAFVERKHESHMSALAAALDSERWLQCEVSGERQGALNRLCSGRAAVSTRGRFDNGSESQSGTTTKSPDATVEGVRYKVVWSCLLLVEMVMTNISCAAHFHSLASNVVGKVCELLRLFNSRATQLVLGAGAIHSAARLKSINAKHLSLVTQCLGMILAILPHIRAALMRQLPPKQHPLLTDLDKIKKEYADHNEKVLNKFVTIIGGIVEHGLGPRIGGTDFDARGKEAESNPETYPCCVFLEGVWTNTGKMHQVLITMLPPDHLQDVFSRIFAYLDQKVPALFIAADAATIAYSLEDKTKDRDVRAKKGAEQAKKKPPPAFTFPKSESGKRRLLDEVDTVTSRLNGLRGVQPWDFSATSVLRKKLDLENTGSPPVDEESNGNSEKPAPEETKPEEADSTVPASAEG